MFKIDNDVFYCVNGTEIESETNSSNTLLHIFSSSDDQYNVVYCSRHIGFTDQRFSSVSFLVLAIIGLILNLIVLCRSNKKVTQGSRKESSMKKLFSILTLLDCLISIYWIISSTVFVTASQISQYRAGCFSLSLLYITIFTFEFMFINIILFHFRKLSLNPIEGILKPEKNMCFYISSSLILGFAMAFIAYFFGIIGRSPMITCFINTEQTEYYGLVFSIPILLILFIVIQVIYDLNCREMFITDKEVREVYKRNSTYVLVYSILHFPYLALIMYSSVRDSVFSQYRNEHYLEILTYIVTVVTCSIPCIIGIIKLGVGFTKIRKIRELSRRLTRSLTKSKPRKSFSDNLQESLESVDQFDWLEKHYMEYFMRDILVWVATCIYNSKINEKKQKFGEKDNLEIKKYNINFNNFILNDESVKKSDYLDVNITEYAPKYFAYLRKLENIDIDEMIESFLPKNNKKGISKSQGSSGSFFISTDDNHYMIKTLRPDEFDLIRHTFVKEYVEHLKKNPKSLLSRIYGMYSVIINQGEEVLIIMMRNVIGDFTDNIIAKYDLKGSTANRKSEFDAEKTDESTMKDLNFNEIEYGIMVSKEHIKRLRKETKSDSEFLRRLNLMDYSLFLVKLTLTKEQSEEIFGKRIKEKQEKAFNELMVTDSLDEMNENININDMPRASIRDGGQIFDVRHYKNYLFPSLTAGTAYLLSIIDYFQTFNFSKQIESGIKTKINKEGKNAVSCVDPETYSKRFINYILSLTDIQGFLKNGSDSRSSSLDSNVSDHDEKEKMNPEFKNNRGSSIELAEIKNN